MSTLNPLNNLVLYKYRFTQVNQPPPRQSQWNKNNKKWRMVHDPHCFYCRQPVFAYLPNGHPSQATIDHIYPIFDIRRGFVSEFKNTVLCCRKCNQGKAKEEEEWMYTAVWGEEYKQEPHIVGMAKIALAQTRKEITKSNKKMKKTEHEIILFKDANQVIYTYFDNTSTMTPGIFWDGAWGEYTGFNIQGETVVLERKDKKKIELPASDIKAALSTKNGFSLSIDPNSPTGRMNFKEKLNPRKR